MHARAGASTGSPAPDEGRRPSATTVPGGPVVLVVSSTGVTVPAGAVVVSAGAVEVVAAAFGALALVGAWVPVDPAPLPPDPDEDAPPRAWPELGSTIRDDSSTASKAPAGTRLRSEMKPSSQLLAASPWKYQLEPLSARMRP